MVAFPSAVSCWVAFSVAALSWSPRSVRPSALANNEIQVVTSSCVPYLRPSDLEPGVLQRRDDPGPLVAPLDDEVRLEGQDRLDVGGERVVGDVMTNRQGGREDRPEDPVAHSDPRGVLHPDEMVGALVDGDEDRRGRLRDGDDPAGRVAPG